MILLDVNILVHAYRPDSARHDQFRDWLQTCLAGAEPFAVPPIVMSALLRITTNPRIYRDPEPLGDVLAFLSALRQSNAFVAVTPGPGHWGIFEDLCRKSGARGNLIPHAFLAAIAIEAGGVWITTDRDFARFPGLKWRHPLD